MTDPIIEKLHKILAKTVENGCTEDEADTALQMAAGIMARHGITQDQLSKTEIKNLARVGKRVSREFKKYQLLVAQAAGELYGCKYVMYGRGKFGLEFVGRPDNIDAAEETMFWLLSQVEYFYKESLPRGLSVSARAQYRRTFKEACALRVLHRAQHYMMEITRNEQVAQSSTGSTALVVEGYFKKLHLEVEEVMESMVLGKARTMKFSYGSGTQDGNRAGDRVQLRREVQ